jgi:hypothetical protein
MPKVDELYVEIGARLDKLDGDLAKLDGKMKKSSSSVEQTWGAAFTRVATLAAGAFTLDAILSYTQESVRLAGELEGVKAKFVTLNSPNLLNNLRAATRGTVDDLELMKASVRADNFKIPLEKLGTFFQFATQRSAETGESVDYLVNSIVDGIGRKSTLVLDNLGISASELQQEIKKTGDFGKAAANIIESSMSTANDAVETGKQKAARLNAEYKNIQLELGEKLIPTYNDFNDVLNKVLFTFKESVGQGGLLTYREAIEKNERANDAFSISLKRINEELSNWGTAEQGIKSLETYIEQLDEAEEKIKRQIALNHPILGLNEDQVNLLKEQLEGQQKLRQALEAQLKGLQKESDFKKAHNGLTEAQYEKQQELNRAIEESIVPLTTIRDLHREMLNASQGKFNVDELLNIQKQPKLETNGLVPIGVEEEEAEALEDTSTTLDDINEKYDRMNEAIATAGDTFSSVFDLMIIEGQSFGQSFSNVMELVLRKITSAIASAVVLASIFSIFTGASFGKLFSGSLNSSGLGFLFKGAGGAITPQGLTSSLPSSTLASGSSQANVNVTGNLIGRGDTLQAVLTRSENRRTNFF